MSALLIHGHENSCFVLGERPERGGESYNHLGILGYADTLALDNLDVVQTAKDLMLDPELGAHGKLGALLDLEGGVLESGLAAGLGEVELDWRAAGRIHGEGLDDADAGVRRVGEVRAATAEAEGLLVALEGLVAGIFFLCG